MSLFEAHRARWSAGLKSLAGQDWAQTPLRRARLNWEAGWVRKAAEAGWPEIAIFGWDADRARGHDSAAGIAFTPWEIVGLDADGADFIGGGRWSLWDFGMDASPNLIWEA